MSRYFSREYVSEAVMWLGIGAMLASFTMMPSYRSLWEYSIHRGIAADNITTGVLSAICVVVLLANRKTRVDWSWQDRRFDFYATVALVAALGFHRDLWAPWRLMLDAGALETAQMYRDTWAQMTSLPQGVWWVAFWILPAPFYRQWFGRGWPWLAFAVTTIIWALAYNINDLINWT